MKLKLPSFAARSAGGVAGGADTPEVIAFDDRCALVFGATWRSIVTRGGHADMQKQARAAKATHILKRPQQVGYARLPGNDMPPRLYAAAVVLGREHQVDALYIIDLGEGAFWLAIVRNGAPTSLDRVLRGLDSAEALDEARDALERIRAEAPDTKIFTNIEHSGFEGCISLSFASLVEAARNSDQVFEPVKLPSLADYKVPLAIAGLVVLALAANQGWKQWQQAQRAKLAAANQPEPVDAHALWTQQIQQWQFATPAPDASTLGIVARALNTLPVTWEGWHLASASCALAEGSPDLRWQCTGLYERQTRGILTREMQKRIPGDWQVSFTPLNEMQVVWSVQTDSPRVDIASLPDKQFHRIETVSKLQRLQSAFTEVPQFAFEQVAIPAPVSPDGQAIPPDERVQSLSQASLSLQTPLRTLEVLAVDDLRVSWRKVSLVPSRDGQGQKPDLKSSALMAKAEGVLYANR